MKLLLLLTLGGSVPALLLLALRYFVLRRMPSTVYYYAWLLVLLRFALPLPGLIPTAAETAAPAPAAYSAAPAEEHGGQAPEFFLPNAAPDGAPVVPAEAQLPAQAAERAEAREPAASPKRAVAISWRSPGLWLSVWGIGTALSLGLTAAAYLRFTVRLRRELRRPDRFACALYASIPGRKPALYRSAAVRTPLTFGVFSPAIVLPEHACDEETLLNVFRHELMHYRRLDTLYKWVAAAILSAHWFNPLSWVVRRELNRACELSCDEMLLRSMSGEERRSYGNALLSMAAMSALPAGVVATTFATEKRNLKERLVQIMNYKKSGARLLASLLALALLTGCSVAAGPKAQSGESAPALEDGAVRVTNVDEFLAAIAPNATIVLEAGEYDLSAASDYGGESSNPCYTWRTVGGDGDEPNAELAIQNVDGLTIRGAGMDQTTIAAVPRYANVLRFVGCRNLSVSGLTAGHTAEPGFCSGGVLRLENCTDVNIDACGLYGCGTIGVDAADTNGLSVTGCSIYECSFHAVSAHQCRSVRVEDCEIYRHGTREGQGSGISLFTAAYSDHVVIHNNRVHDNAAQFLLQLNYTKDAVFLSNEVHDNRFDSGVFQFEQYGATVDGCEFRDNGTRSWVQSAGVYANDVTGKLLDAADFESMTLREIDPDTAVTPAPVSAAADVRPGGSILVRTVDEFLAAIGPDRSILLEGELFDLSTASNYGSVGGEYYYWQDSHDGPALVIHDLSGLSIGTSHADRTATTLAAIPRYADVLSFRDCDRIQLTDFTAGHTKEPGSCSGGVLNFQNCSEVTLQNMGLYGCGILGIQAANCSSLSVLQTEIYECSQGAGNFFQTDGIRFVDCDVHDVPSPAFQFRECGDKTWNDAPLTGLDDMYDVDDSGALVKAELFYEEGLEYRGAVEDLANPFAAEPSYRREAGTPEANFAASVQQAIIDEDWEALTDRIAFPLQFFTDGGSFVIHDRKEYLDMVQNGYFTNEVFNESFRFRQRIADADPSVFGSCVFGKTCLDHLIAFVFFGDQISEEHLYIRAISVLTPLWPGSDPAAGAAADAQTDVPPTPQPAA